MKQLPRAKRAKILSMLCEGSSMRAIARVEDVSFNTVNKLLVDAGLVCASFHDERVRGVKASISSEYVKDGPRDRRQGIADSNQRPCSVLSVSPW